jgi:trehalose 6-phosphate synthase
VGESDSRAVVAVSNRLPVSRADNGWEVSPGGLVSALLPVMTARSGAWIGWDGGSRGMSGGLPDVGARLVPVRLSPGEVRQYYHGFANATLWPLLHNAIEKPRFERAWWQSYWGVNGAFASSAADTLADLSGSLCWIHDYQLMLVPRLLRERLGDQRMGFFLHVPWPSPDIYARLPWRREIIAGLLGADVVAFHTERYRQNFLQSCAHLMAGDDLRIGDTTVQMPEGRVVSTLVAPISIDVAEYSRLATDPETEESVTEYRRQFAGRRLLLGVDRLDYTKGIIERLLAFELLLDRREDLRRTVALLQVAVPSRDDVREYQQLRAALERHIGRINGQYTEPGGAVPVHYLHRGLAASQLVAAYATAAALLVTPLIDGMNLVAKEFVTVQQARRGGAALVLSEFTGAAAELHEAVSCNPFDIEGLSERMEYALELPDGRRRADLAAMAGRVQRYDVHEWVSDQLAAIAARGNPPDVAEHVA